MLELTRPIRFLPCLVLALWLGGCGSAPPPQPQRHAFGFDTIVSYDAVHQDGRIDLLLAGRVGDGIELRHAVSSDGGRHWSTPRRVDAGAPPVHGLGHGNDVQIAAAGTHLVAVWPTAGSGWGGAGPLASAVSDDGGRHWRVGPMPAAGFEGGEGYADLRADAQGRFHLVWLDSRNGEQALYHARSGDAGRSWSRPDTVDAATCFCCANTLATAPSGALLALYRDAEPRDMTLATLSGDGAWRRLGVVGDFQWQFKGCPEVGGSLAVVGDTLHALVWTGEESVAGVYYLQSTDGGQSWQRTRRLSGATSHQLSVAAVGAGTLAAAWETRDAAPGVEVVFSADGGAHWSPRFPAFAGDSRPRLLTTPAGGLLIMLHADQALAMVAL